MSNQTLLIDFLGDLLEPLRLLNQEINELPLTYLPRHPKEQIDLISQGQASSVTDLIVCLQEDLSRSVLLVVVVDEKVPEDNIHQKLLLGLVPLQGQQDLDERPHQHPVLLVRTQEVLQGGVLVETLESLHLLTELRRNHLLRQQDVYQYLRQGVTHELHQVVLVEVGELGVGRGLPPPGSTHHFGDVRADDVDVGDVLFEGGEGVDFSDLEYRLGNIQYFLVLEGGIDFCPVDEYLENGVVFGCEFDLIFQAEGHVGDPEGEVAEGAPEVLEGVLDVLV